jgi:hypothetical protein
MMAVLGIPLAFLHYAGRSEWTLGVPLGLGCCCLLCAWILGSSSLWATVFETLALACLLAVLALSLSCLREFG